MGYGDEVPPGRCISYTFFHFCNYVPAGLSPVPFGTPASTSTQCNALIMPYKLSQVLQAHDADVKCVLAIDEHTLFSASRDRTVAQWARQSQCDPFTLRRILAGHEAYVNSLELISSDGQHPAVIASGGNSSLILLHELQPPYPTTAPITALVGHHANVCTLAYSSKRRKLLSASWDCAARIWSRRESSEVDVAASQVGKIGDWECEKVLAGHSAAVWGIGIFEEGPCEGCYITGAADQKIKLWDRMGFHVKDFPTQDDAVRSIAIFPGGKRFAVALNDSTIRILTVEGDTVAILRGHEDYVYHLAVDLDGTLLSCGEDHTVKVWRDHILVDSIEHPCQSVWCASFLPAGEFKVSQRSDVVTAGSDHLIRIFTMDKDHFADVEALDAYQHEVDTAMNKYREHRVPNDANNTAIPNERRSSTTAEHVLDIDIEDDKPPLQLRFTADSDPQATAEAFGMEHNLSASYVDQIRDFLKMQFCPK